MTGRMRHWLMVGKIENLKDYIKKLRYEVSPSLGDAWERGNRVLDEYSVRAGKRLACDLILAKLETINKTAATNE